MSRRDARGPRRWIRGACVGLGMLALAGGAAANGRYPSAQQLVVDPSDPSRLWLRGTYGLLTSADAGKSWYWICEAAVGYSGQEDPMLAATTNGKLFVGAVEGLFITTDHGCSWTASPAIEKDRYVRDLAVEHDGLHVLALTSFTEKNGNYNLLVFRSDDQGDNFAALGPPPSLDLIPLTLDPAPSDPSRIYVTGSVWPLAPAADAGSAKPDASARTNPVAILLRSRDGGKTWDRRPITGASLNEPPYIAAVHPTNPDVLYVRVQGGTNSAGTMDSFLLYTDDAGETWKEIFRKPADMLGFSLSADGSEVRLGFGSPYKPGDPNAERPVDATAFGIYRATAPAFAFTRTLEGQVGCLTQGTAGLYVCGSHLSEHFELGLSKDDGVTASALLDLQGVRGVLACPSSTPTGQLCPAAWQSSNACGLLGPCTPPPVDAGVPHFTPTGTPAKATSSCTCTAPGASQRTPLPRALGGLVTVGALFGWALGRRRRRSSGRHS